MLLSFGRNPARAAAVALLLLGAAVAHAGTGDIARFVRPPGNYGGIPTGPHSLDQLSLYSGLTPLRRNVSMVDVNRFYLPSSAIRVHLRDANWLPSDSTAC